MRIFRNLILLGLIAMTLIIVWVNMTLCSKTLNKEETKQDIKLQLNFLNDELKNNNLGNRMQQLFPEGFIFTHALYGLSWCEMGLADTSKTLKAQALKEALYAYDQINTEEAKSIFSTNLKPENGIYCAGWNNYLLSKILMLDTNFENSHEYKKIYTHQCEEIAEALQHATTPYLESYTHRAWPADMCVAMASLSNHDKIFKPKYQYVISDWVTKVKSKLDPITSLIPHKVDAIDGQVIEGARGCSISLIIRMLSEIDTSFAQQQYQLYKEKFVTTTFGLPSIDEYPKGQSGDGDIDSGPVIFGVGFAGTIVSIGTYAMLGDNELAQNQYKTIHAFGFGNATSKHKKYIFGMLPLADAFICWGRSSGLRNMDNHADSSIYWRLKFQLISFMMLAITWGLFYAKKVSNLFRKNQICIN